MMAALPEAARAELRGRFHTLTLLFRIPLHLGAAPDFPPAPPPPRVGHVGAPEEIYTADIPFADHEEVLPFLPCLAQWGRAAMDSMIASWWRFWRRAAPAGDPLVLELEHVALASDPISPSPSLRAWLRGAGWQDDAMSPTDAPGWLALRQHEAHVQALSALPSRYAGAGMQKRVKPPALRLGRRLHHSKAPVTQLEREDGTLTRDPREVEALLWASRRGIWDAAPMAQEAADALLTSYFEGRDVRFPAAPRPCAPSIIQLILRAFGSSPGLDGQPYEIYHEGTLFVAALLAQAMYMAPWPADLPLVLGPGLDLAVWIPKALASLRAAGLRPLQHDGAGWMFV